MIINVNLRIPDAQHRAIKIAAIKAGKTLHDFIVEAAVAQVEPNTTEKPKVKP